MCALFSTIDQDASLHALPVELLQRLCGFPFSFPQDFIPREIRAGHNQGNSGTSSVRRLLLRRPCRLSSGPLLLFAVAPGPLSPHGAFKGVILGSVADYG